MTGGTNEGAEKNDDGGKSMRYTEKMTGRRVRIVCFSTSAARER
jgi:hypothetical protein